MSLLFRVRCLAAVLLTVCLSTAAPGLVAAQEPNAEGAKQDAPKDDAPKKDAPKKDAPKEDAPKDDAPKEDAPKEDAPKEDAPKEDGADEAKLPEDYAGLRAEWERVNSQLSEVAANYRKAFSNDDRQKIFETEYKPLLQKADRVLPALREAAMKQYQAKPGEDEQLTELLLGFGADAVRRDDYELALNIGKMLREGKCEHPAVHYILGVAAYSTQDFEQAKTELTAAKEAGVLSERDTFLLNDIDDLKKNWEEEQKIREAEAKADDLPRVKLTTNRGEIVIELFENQAPGAVGNFVSLIKDKFYDGLTFHRVLGNFMAQGGCPTGTGTGGPGYNIYCECHQDNYRHHFRGTLSMAHAGRDTGGSQFFLTFRPTPALDGRHTAFGRVIKGMDVLTELQRRDPSARGQAEPDRIVSATVVRSRDHEYKPVKVGEDEPPAKPESEGKLDDE